MSSSDIQYKKMSETPIPKLILSLGLPTIISMLITNLYNMADTWFVSQIGTSASGAVGVIFGLMAIIQAFGFTFGHGSGSNISRHLGAKENNEANIFASTGFFGSVFAGLIICILGLVFLQPLCLLLGSTRTILPYSTEYAFFILLSAPAMASSCVLNNILRYEGYASYAMLGLVSGSLLNIGGDAFFIKVLNMGVSGAGLSTMISQYISFGILLSFYLRGKTQSKLSIKKISFKNRYLLNIICTGFPSMLRQGLASVSVMILNGRAAIYGDEAIAALSVVSRICNFLFSIALGIGQGFQPVSSFNYGAKLYDRVKKAYFFTLWAGLCMMLVLSIFGFVFSNELIRAFLKDEYSISIGVFALRLQCITLVTVPLCVCGNMLFQSIGLSGRAMFLAALRSGLAFIPTVYIMSGLFNLRGLQLAQPVADVISAAISLPIALHFLHKSIGITKKAE